MEVWTLWQPGRRTEPGLAGRRVQSHYVPGLCGGHGASPWCLLPAAREHAAVEHLPPDVDVAWNEAVNSAGAGSFTASEIMCRKILMHVAVDKTGADEGKAFTEYIDALDSAGYIPTGLKPKIDEIRTRGNVANHELSASDKEVADRTLSVTRFLLVSIYELPNQ